MAFRYDKPYRPNINIDSQKIYNLFNLIYQMDTQELLQYSLINKIPLSVINPSNGNNLIHEILLNDDKTKNEFNKLNVIKFLVQNDANPDEPNKDNQTPIHIACQKQLKEIVEYFVNVCEVNLNYKDNNGFTPLHYLLIGDIKLFEKKEISSLVTFQRKGDIVKKDKIIEIKKMINPVLNQEPFMQSLEKTIYETLKNSPEIDQILLDTQSKIQKNISSTDPLNKLKEYKEIISIQRNEMKKIVDRLWNKFPNTDRLELHAPTNDSYKIEDSIGLIKNVNIKKEIKKTLYETVDKFKEYSEDIISHDNEADKLDEARLINDIYTDFVKNSNNMINNRNNIMYNDDVNFTTNNYDVNLFNELNNNHTSQLANDFADNIIDIDNNIFYGGSRDIRFDGNHRDITQIKSWFKNEKDDELKFRKLFVYLFFPQGERDITDADNVNELIDAVENFPFINLQLQLKKDYVVNYIDKLFQPEYATKIYCEYTKLCCFNNNNSLNGFYDILIMNFMGCLMHQHYTFEHFISHLSFYLIFINDAFNGDNTKALKLIFSHMVTPMFDFTNFINSNNVSGIDLQITEIFNLIDSFYNNKDNSMLEKIIEKINNMVENNKIKVPNIMVADFIYMIKNEENIDFFKHVISGMLNKDNIKYILNNIPITFGDNYNDQNIMKLLLGNFCPSFKNYIYCLLNDDSDFCFNKYLESIHLKLNFRGILPILIEDIDGNNDYIVNLNKKTPNILHITPYENNFSLPLLGNYYFSENQIDDIPENYFEYNNEQYRPPFKLSLYNLQVLNINKITRIINNIFTNDANSYYVLLNSIKQGKIKNISNYYLDLYFLLNNLIKIQQDISDSFRKYNEKDIGIKIFDINKLNNFLNTINSHIFLYYYLFSNGELKIPKFSYFRVESDKSFIFESNYELSLPDNDPSDIDNDFIKINGIIKSNNKKTKPNYFKTYLSNIFLDNVIIKNKQYAQNKDYTLPPSMEVELGRFYEYNKILLLQNSGTKYDNVINKIKELTDELANSKITKTQEYFYLFKLIEENIKDQTELYAEKAISKLLNESKITEINYEQIYSIGEYRDTKITFDKDVDDNFFNNYYLFRNKDATQECNFIIYPNEYSNTNVLKQMYCLNINQEILQFLINNNVDPYAIDDNGNSIINPLEKTYHYKSIRTLRNNDIDIINFGLPKNPFTQLSNDSNNHIKKLLKGINFNDYITNFTSSQYNEIKLILLSNDRFGNNIINYLDTSFKTIFYIINEYLSDTMWRFNDSYKFDDMNKIFTITQNNKNNISINYLFNYINDKQIPSTKNIIIMKDYLKQLSKEKDSLNFKINKISNEIVELHSKGGLKINTFDLKNKKKEIVKQINKIGIIRNNIINRINKDTGINKYTTNKIPKKIINTYDNFLIGHDVGVYLECWEELFKSDLTKSWNLDLIKICNKECELLKPHKMNIDEYKNINTFYKQLNDLSKIYFEESKYTEKNKVLKFVYELLEHMTKTYICFNIEMTLRNLLIKYFTDLSNDNNFVEINKKIDYLLDAENVISNKKFTDILYNDLPKEFVKNSVDIFINYDDKQTFEPKSIKEILNDLFNLLTVGDIVNIPTNSPFMQILNSDLTDYFDLFVQKLINNWLVVIENTFKFTINQYRINTCILELIKHN